MSPFASDNAGANCYEAYLSKVDSVLALYCDEEFLIRDDKPEKPARRLDPIEESLEKEKCTGL
jgi:hypothetical protein